MVKKALILGLTILFIQCEPTKPNYDIGTSDNQLVLGCLITCCNSLHYLDINATEFKNANKQLGFSNDSLIFHLYKNNQLADTKLVIEKDSTIWGIGYKYYYRNYFQENFSVDDKIKLVIAHDDYETISGEATIPDSVELTNLRQDTVLNELPENFKIKWKDTNSAEAYYVRLFLKAENNDSTDFEVELTNETYWELYQTSYSQFENHYNISKYDLKNALKNVIEIINRSIDYEDNKIEIQIYDYSKVYLYAKVLSLDLGASYVFADGEMPDELSGFSSKCEIYSNVKNGKGLIGAYSKSNSKKIILNKNLIKEILNE